jgi:mannonate dehydratase
VRVQSRIGIKYYSEEEQRQAEAYYKAMSEADIEKLTRNIIAGLPGK